MTGSVQSDLLKGIRFFDGIPDTLVWHLARAGSSHHYETNELLFRDGDERSFFAVIVKGNIAIEHGPDAVRLATLGPGDVVGEGVLLEETRHSTAARALVPTEVLWFTKDRLEPLLKDKPALHAALVARAAAVIAARLKSTDATVTRRGRSLGFGGGALRREKDLLGERDLPDAALYGVQTLRAMENFPITGVTLRDFPELIVALAQVKEAAAVTNVQLGLLEPRIGNVIVLTCREIVAGRHHEHFVVDMIQGGSGTSSNMNANEVIANRALELLGEPRGSYDVVSPNDHVNQSQSTNDVHPTAVKIAVHKSISVLQAAMRSLVDGLLRKGVEFAPHLKMGRTELQDAVPMTLGQEFSAFAHTIQEDIERLTEAQALIRETNMGATAIGTGITAGPGYAELVCERLSEISGLKLVTAPDLVEATSDMGAFVQVSGVLKRCAVKLSKVCNDLRLLSSGPRAGLGEINLPPVQPGSSMMPGKVNPVIPEVVNQVCFYAIGSDVTVTMAAEAGQLQLNPFEPIIAFELLRTLSSLGNACTVLRERCVDGITANPERMRRFVETSVGIVTALVPELGFARCTEIATEALASGRGVYELVLERGWMTKDALDRALNPRAMVGSG